jgi:cytoskeletal protein RodZ
MNMQEAGETIQKHREERNLTQAQLAEQTKTPLEIIREVEDGTIEELDIRVLSNICLRIGLELLVVPERPPPTFQELDEQNQKQRMTNLAITDQILAETLDKMSMENTS